VTHSGLTSLTQGTSVVTFEHDDADRRTASVLPNGIRVEYGYDAASQLTTLTYKRTGVVIGNLQYTYDAGGRRTSMQGTWARTVLPSPVTTANYDAANRLTLWNGRTLTYDDNGSMLTDGARTYGWDARNQLSSIGGAGAASFTYDAFGRRIAKNVAGAGTDFLYSGTAAVQELIGGLPNANVLPGPLDDEVLLRMDGSGVNTVLADGLGSPLALLDEMGAPLTQYTYGPFGSTVATGAVSTNSNQYTGRENDASGLYFYRARYYAPELQRFIGEDPIRESGGLNLYAYVDNNPIVGTDPTGLQVKGRQSDGSYRADLNDPRLSALVKPPFPQASASFGESDQCVSLTKYFSGAPCTGCWRKGPPVLGNSNLTPGTAIATFDDNGRYPQDDPQHPERHTPRNSAMYVGQSGTDIWVIDQWPGHPALYRRIPRNGNSVSNQSGAYSVIVVPPGTRSSKCQCLQ
jgi:RHS repeat-associated protein